MITVAASGYFDPLHIGHLEYLARAKDCGDNLIVIVNNDRQTTLKKGRPFMNEDERLAIIQSLRWVDSVSLSIDKDLSVCKSLARLKPDIFAKGGDRTIDNIPERETCEKLGIKIITGLGKKRQSSSVLVEKQSSFLKDRQLAHHGGIPGWPYNQGW